MLVKKITLTEKHFNKTVFENLVDLKINPETVLVKINSKFAPLSTTITKKTQLEILVVVK